MPRRDLVLGDYRLVERLDEGGQGEVWLAGSPQGQVVIKIAHAGTGGGADRFGRELRAARSVRSAFVAQPLDWDPDPRPTWIAYERVHGVPLDRHLRENDQLPLPDAVSLLGEVGKALVDIHALELVHCDIKPANVMVLKHNRAKVLDLGAVAFGVGSELSRVGFGTDGWRSPEQGMGSRLTTASDVFSLGLLIVKVVSGHVAFSADFRLGDDPDLRGLPVALAPLVVECLSVDPAERPIAAEVADRLAVVREAKAAADAEWAAACTRRPQELVEAQAWFDCYVPEGSDNKRRAGRTTLEPLDWSMDKTWLSDWTLLARLSGVKFTCGRFGVLSAVALVAGTPAWGEVVDEARLEGYLPHTRGCLLSVGDWYRLNYTPGQRGRFARIGLEPYLPYGRQRRPAVTVPTTCPSCGTKLQERRTRWPLEDRDKLCLLCPSGDTCPAQVASYLSALVFQVLDRRRIDFVPLVEDGGIADLVDLFEPTMPSRLAERGGEAASRLAAAIEVSLDGPEEVLLFWLFGGHRPRAKYWFSDGTLKVGVEITDLLADDGMCELPTAEDGAVGFYLWKDEPGGLYGMARAQGGWRLRVLRAAHAARRGRPERSLPQARRRRGRSQSNPATRDWSCLAIRVTQHVGGRLRIPRQEISKPLGWRLDEVGFRLRLSGLTPTAYAMTVLGVRSARWWQIQVTGRSRG